MNRTTKKCTLAAAASLMVAASAFGSHYAMNRKAGENTRSSAQSVRTATTDHQTTSAEASAPGGTPEAVPPGLPDTSIRKMADELKSVSRLPAHDNDGVRIYYVVQQYADPANHNEKGAYYLDVDDDNIPHCYKLFDSSVFGPFISRGSTAIEDNFYALYQTSNSSPWWDYYVRYDVNTWEHNDFWNEDIQMSSLDMAYDPWTDQLFGFSSYNYAQSSYALSVLDFENKSMKYVGPEISYAERIVALAADRKCLYAFDNNGNLYTVDKTDGTKVLVGSTGLSFANRQHSAVIDMRTGRLFLSATLYDSQAGKNCSGFWEIDKQTAQATQILDLGFDQQNIGLWSEELSGMSCPDLATGLTIDIPAGELSGSLSFTAPTALRDGSPAAGKLTYEVIVNGKSIATGDTEYGAEVSIPLSVDSADSYKISVKTSNSEGPSRYARLESVIGFAKPSAPSVSLEFDSSQHPVVTWNPVTTSDKGVEIEADQITYSVTRYPDGTTIASDITGTSVTDTDNLDESFAIYYYGVSSRFSGVTYSDETLSDGFCRGSATAPHEFDGFSRSTSHAFAIINGDGDDCMWKYDNSLDKERDYMFLWESHDPDNVNNDWLIAPPVHLEAGYYYQIQFNMMPTHNHSVQYEIRLGKDTSLESLDTEVCSDVMPDNDEWSWQGEFVRVTETGDYRPALGITGPNGTSGVKCRGYRISAAKDPGAPSGVTDFNGHSGTDNPWLLEMSFRAPETDFEGRPLEKIDRITVSREGETVEVYSNVTPGQAIKCTSMVAETGREYYFTIVASNNFGDGRELIVPVYAGVRRSAPVSEVYAWQSSPGKMTINWKAPETDEVGNPINPADMTYTIYESDGYVNNAIASGITGLSYSFDYSPENPSTQTFASFMISTTTEGGNSEVTPVIPVAVGNSLGYPYAESFANGSVSNTLGMFNVAGNASWGLYRDANFSDLDCQDGDNGLIGLNSSTRGDAAMLLLPRISLKDAVEPVYSCYTYNIAGSAGPDDNEVEILVNDGSGFRPAYSTRICDLGNPEWNRIKTSLSAYKGKDIQIAIKGTIVTYTFILIDNMRVSDNVTDNLAVASISCDDEATAGEKFPVRIRVENLGDNPAVDFSIRLLRDDEQVAEMNVDKLAAGTGRDFIITYESTPFDSKRVGFRAEIAYDKDLVADDNSSETVRVRFKTPTHPAVGRLDGTLGADNEVLLDWDTPDLDAAGVVYHTEDFASAEPWSQTDASGWTLLDRDGRPAGGMQQLDIPGHTDAEGNPVPVGFFVVDSSSDIFGATAQSWASMSGDRHLCSIYASGGANDDWAISPKLDGRAQTVSFYARSYSADYPETLRVLCSTSGNEPGDFTELRKFSGMSDEWTRYDVELPEGAVYFAFNCVSDDCFMLFIDCVTYSTGERYELLGYNLYRNAKRINDGLLKGISYTDRLVPAGEHSYAVTAVYTQGESAPSPEAYIEISGVGLTADETIIVSADDRSIRISGATGKHVAVADAAGRTVYAATPSADIRIPCGSGVYIVTAAGKSVKVIVR